MFRSTCQIRIAVFVLLTVSLAGVLVPQTSWADYVRIRGTVVNVRQGPGTTYPTLFQAEEGEEYALQSVEGLWCRIALVDGREAWVFGRLVTVMKGDLPGVSETEQEVSDQEGEVRGSKVSAFLAIFLFLLAGVVVIWKWRALSKKAARSMREISGYRRSRPFQYDDRSPDRDRWEI